MRKMPVVILAGSALIGLTAAYYVTHARKAGSPKLPPNVFVSADQQGLVEMPGEPQPLPEPPLMPVLLQPEPMPTPGDGREITVSLRQPVEEEMVPEPIPAPTQEPPLEVVIANPEEAPASEELIAMPAEETASESMTLPTGHTHQHSPFPPYPLSVPAAPAVPTAPVQIGASHPDPLPLPAMVFTISRPRVSAHSEVLPLTGTHPCSLENKVELTLPESVRPQMTKAPRVLYLAIAPDQKCVWIYTSAAVEQLGRMAGSDEQSCANRRILFSRLQLVTVDSDGLFALPANLIEAAELGKDVILIGVHDHFELWDAKRWQEYSNKDRDPERTQEGIQ